MSSSGSSKKGKNSKSQKPKPPQRGLGVAQLEQIRMQSQVNEHDPSLCSPFRSHLTREPNYMPLSSPTSSFSTTSPSFPQQSFATADRINKTGDLRRSGYLPDLIDRNSSQHIAAPLMMLSPSEETMQGAIQKKRRQDVNLSLGSSSQNSGSNSDQEELDLELKLST